MENVIQPLIAQLSDKQDLTYDQSTRAFQVIMNGGATPAQIAAFVMALRMKGETADEIAGGVAAMLAKTPTFRTPEFCMDTCGTGGDGKGTLNISTAAAFVLAACGVPVAKHGNRAVSSKAGSADVLHELGIKIDAEQAVMERCLEELNICFLFAPKYHSAMRHVAPVRQELGMKSVFNLLGPLTNPARPKWQLLGVFGREWIVKMGHVLKLTGCNRAWIVYGNDGTDELSLTGTSFIAELKDNDVNTFEIVPDDADLTIVSPETLRGGDAAHNAQKLREMLMGNKTPYREAVLLNVSASLIIAGKAQTLDEGVEIAEEAINSGAAYKVLQHFIDMSRKS